MSYLLSKHFFALVLFVTTFLASCEACRNDDSKKKTTQTKSQEQKNIVQKTQQNESNIKQAQNNTQKLTPPEQAPVKQSITDKMIEKVKAVIGKDHHQWDFLAKKLEALKNEAPNIDISQRNKQDYNYSAVQIKI